MFNNDISNVINAKGRVPYFHKDFPLILFWSHKSGCTSLLSWFFYQINLLGTTLKDSSDFMDLHNYEFTTYKADPTYQSQLITALQHKQKDTFKLVRNPYKRAVSSFIFYIPFLGIQNPIWNPMRKFLYNNENSHKGFSFKQFLYYLQHCKKNNLPVDPHFDQQYILGEEQFVTNYIYLEDFQSTIQALETKYNLKKSPLSSLVKFSHHQTHNMTYSGYYAETDITDPKFPKLPTYESFYDTETKELVKSIFHQDFKMYNYSTNYNLSL